MENIRQYIKFAVSNNELVGLGITALDYLKLHKPESREKKGSVASVREMRLWILNGSVGFNNPELDQEYSIIENPYQMLNLPIRAVLFPKKWPVFLPTLNVKIELTQIEA